MLPFSVYIYIYILPLMQPLRDIYKTIRGHSYFEGHSSCPPLARVLLDFGTLNRSSGRGLLNDVTQQKDFHKFNKKGNENHFQTNFIFSPQTIGRHMINAN